MDGLCGVLVKWYALPPQLEGLPMNAENNGDGERRVSKQKLLLLTSGHAMTLENQGRIKDVFPCLGVHHMNRELLTWIAKIPSIALVHPIKRRYMKGFFEFPLTRPIVVKNREKITVPLIPWRVGDFR